MDLISLLKIDWDFVGIEAPAFSWMAAIVLIVWTIILFIVLFIFLIKKDISIRA